MRIPDRVEQVLADNAGIAHRDVLHAAGLTDHALRTAVARGGVRSVRRAWFLLPSAPHDLVRAATVGGRLTCVSATRRLGIWTPEATSGHIAVPANRSRIDDRSLRMHYASGPVPIPRSTLVDPVENVLFHVARCLPPREALAVWESAVRIGAVTREHLERVQWGSATTAVRALLERMSVLSDSGLETFLVDGLRPFGLRIRQQVRIDGHPVDLLIGDKLVVQADGYSHHSSSAQRSNDIRDDARLVLLGYTVLRFSYAQILYDWPFVERTILAAVAQGRHLAA